MTGARSTGRIAVAICLTLALAACSGSTDPDSAQDTGPTTTGSEDSTQETTTTSVSAETSIPPSLRDLRGDLGVGVVILDPSTETGSHPTLSWQPIEGAASYWLVLRDADDRPFWAWTGTGTTIRVGGGDSPDTNQTAALHEEMTWSVAAFDGEGNLVALSDPASVAP